MIIGALVTWAMAVNVVMMAPHVTAEGGTELSYSCQNLGYSQQCLNMQFDMENHHFTVPQDALDYMSVVYDAYSCIFSVTWCLYYQLY